MGDTYMVHLKSPPSFLLLQDLILRTKQIVKATSQITIEVASLSSWAFFFLFFVGIIYIVLKGYVLCYTLSTTKEANVKTRSASTTKAIQALSPHCESGFDSSDHLKHAPLLKPWWSISLQVSVPSMSPEKWGGEEVEKVEPCREEIKLSNKKLCECTWVLSVLGEGVPIIYIISAEIVAVMGMLRSITQKYDQQHHWSTTSSERHCQWHVHKSFFTLHPSAEK